MPKDINGKFVKVGMLVYVPCIVKIVTEGEDYRNLTVETQHTCPPSEIPDTYTLNTKQVIVRKK